MTRTLRHLGKNPDAARARIEAGAAKGIRYGLWKLGNLEFQAAEFREALELYKLAANLGLALAARAAGWMYANGVGCQQPDLTLARFYFEVASDSCGRSALEAGLYHLYGRGCEPNVEQAQAFLRKAADAGTPRAKSLVAYVEATGTAPLESHGQSLLKLVELCREGNAAADYAVGMWWLEGMVGSVNLERAASGFNHAAEQGHIQAKVELARLLLSGEGVQVDAYQAVKLLNEATDAGVTEAMVDLAAFLLEGRYGMPADPTRAMRLLERASDAGSVSAMVLLARVLHGSAGDADHHRIKVLLERAVDAGSADAAHLLPHLIEERPDLWSDKDRRERLTVCAEAGSTDAMIMLAKGAVDHETKIFWLEAAVQDGSVFAQYAMACELWSLRTRAASAEALAHWKQAARIGSVEAAEVLADLYLTGNRVKRNPRLAVHYLEAVAGSGDATARVILQDLYVRGVVEHHAALGKVLSMPSTKKAVQV
jgi:TPR repeat protein